MTSLHLKEERDRAPKHDLESDIDDNGSNTGNSDRQKNSEAEEDAFHDEEKQSKAGSQKKDDKESETKSKPKPKPEMLVITEDEQKCMQQLSPIFGHTARTIHRYVNIYRLIKAHSNLNIEGPYNDDEFKPIMLMLAIVVGCPARAENFLKMVSLADGEGTFGAFIEKNESVRKLAPNMTKICSEVAMLPMKHLERNRELISRFSFRTLMVK